jgi:MSHA biogenesis protein MshK
MAEYLSKALKGVRIRVAGFSMAACLPLFGFAQGLPDPTRPPASLGVVESASAVASTSGPELQSILISPTRRIAIISGQHLRQGDKFGEARVARISESEVVLRNGSESQVLKLFPQIEKHPASRGTHPKVNDRQ